MNTNRKNVVIVCHHFPPHITGVGNVAYNQALLLSKLGNVVTVVTSETSNDEKSKYIENIKVVRVKAFNFLEKIDAPFPIFYPEIITKLKSIIKESDIVHVHDAFYLSTISAVLIAKFYKKPIVLTQHVSLIAHPSRIIVFIEKMVYGTYGKMVFKLSDSIITYNDRVRKFLTDHNVDSNKIVNIFNGVDLEVFSPVSVEKKKSLKEFFGLDTSKKVVLFVGRFVHKKGYDHVLSAKDPRYQIVFAGGEIKNSKDGIVHLGKMSKKELSNLYKAADVFVLPSVSEGFPLCIQEAMSSGLPVITAYDYGYEIYGLDKNLLKMIDRVSDESVKKAINELIFDDIKLSEMSIYSRKYAEENFNWDISSEKLSIQYERLLIKDKKKKIAFVSDSVYPYNIGGKEKRLYEVTKRLSAKGYGVTVYCMKWWKEEVSEIIIENIKYKAISNYYPLYDGNIRSMKQGIMFALSCLKMIKEDFDVLDVDHMTHLNIYSMKIVSLLKLKKMTVTWHEVWGKQYWQEYLGPILGYIAYCIELVSARLPDQIISVSSKTTRDLENVLGVKIGVVTIPNGLDLDFIEMSGKSKNESDVIFAGRLLPNKNVDVLISAINIVKTRGLKLKVNIVGDGPERLKLENQVSKLGLGDQINFLGFVKENYDLYGLIKSSKVFVLPSNREGFGIAVIEANACGIPVITINDEHNAAKDLIVNGQNGEVCGLSDIEIADAIINVLESNNDKSQYVSYSIKYDWSGLLNKFSEAYQ